MIVKRSLFRQLSPTGRIAKGVLTALLPVLLLALAAPSKAQQLQQFSRNAGAEQSYDYLYVGFARSSLTDVDGETPSGFGIELVGSKSFGDNFHVWGNGGRASVGATESLGATEYDLSVTTTVFNIGVGTQFDASEKASFFARAGFIFLDATLDIEGGGESESDSENWDGYNASIGAITFPTPEFGLSASAERIEVDEDAEFFLGVSAQYRPTDEFTARAFIQRGISDDASDYNVLGVTGEYRFTDIVAAYAGVTSISPDDDEVDVRAIGAGLRFHLP